MTLGGAIRQAEPNSECQYTIFVSVFFISLGDSGGCLAKRQFPFAFHRFNKGRNGCIPWLDDCVKFSSCHVTFLSCAKGFWQGGVANLQPILMEDYCGPMRWRHVASMHLNYRVVIFVSTWIHNITHLFCWVPLCHAQSRSVYALWQGGVPLDKESSSLFEMCCYQ